MIPKKIGETGWTVQDWDSQWPAVFTCTEERPGTYDLTIEVDRDGDAHVEFLVDSDSDFGGTRGVRAYIPLDVLAEVLRR